MLFSRVSLNLLCTPAVPRSVPWHRYMSQVRSSSNSGRVAIVTGASRGIGRAIALRLASDGYNMALNDLPSTTSALDEVRAAIADKGRKVFISAGDVAKEDDIKRLVAGAADELGSVDVMIANAGISGILKPLVETTADDWDEIFSVNSRGVFLCYKYAAEQMIKQGRGGRIIGAASVAGMRGMRFAGPYSATKFSVRGLTQTASQEWAKYGINVNAYAPGPILTAMLEKADGVGTEGADLPVNAQGAVGAPEDIAGLVSYLVSEEARFITGQTVPICGGMVFS